MNPERTLGEFEQIVLLAVLRLGDEAYGVTILDEIAARTGRNPAPGALYTTLHRMEDKGLVTFRDGSPTPERGGRAKRFVIVTREGRNALASAQSAYQSLLQGLDLLTDPVRYAALSLKPSFWRSQNLCSLRISNISFTLKNRVPHISLLRHGFGGANA